MYSTFATELVVRPDDIDMNNHVHNTRYLDYLLAARYDQMARCYGMGMEEFIKLGYSWVNSKAYIEYKRQLRMNDVALVSTRIEEFNERGCKVWFQISNKATGKVCCDGWCEFVMVSIESGRAIPVPDWIRQKYEI